MRHARYSAERDADGAVLRDGEAGAMVRIQPENGNLVTSFETQVAGRAVAALAPRGIPIMFPFPNRVPFGRYRWRGREHRLDENEHGRRNHIHGLVRQKPWRVTSVDQSDGASLRASIDLSEFPDVMRQYPFPCVLTVTTRLRDGRLEHDAAVSNTGDETLPFGYGLHPWLPVSLRGDRAATEVRIPASRRWELVEKVPTGQTLAVEHRFDFRDWNAVGAEAYDDVFTQVVRREDGWSEAGVRYPADGVEIRFEASAAFREWVLFVQPDLPALALEPYTCPTNAINLEGHPGIVALAPGATWAAAFRLSIREL